MVGEVPAHLGDELGVVGAGVVEPEHGGGARGSGPGDRQLHPVSDREVLGLVHAPDVARLHRVLEEHGAGLVDHAHRAGGGDLEGLVVGAVLLGRLRHEPDVGYRTHRVRVRSGVLLDRGGGPSVGVALAQHRVHGAALDLVVAGARLALGVGGRVLGIVGHRIALGLQFLHGRLELRDRRADVRQLDDVGLGLLGEGPELRDVVAEARRGLQVLGEAGDDAPREGDVARLDGHAGGGGEGPDDREQRVGGEGRGFVGEGVDDLRVPHRGRGYLLAR